MQQNHSNSCQNTHEEKDLSYRPGDGGIGGGGKIYIPMRYRFIMKIWSLRQCCIDAEKYKWTDEKEQRTQRKVHAGMKT